MVSVFVCVCDEKKRVMLTKYGFFSNFGSNGRVVLLNKISP